MIVYATSDLLVALYLQRLNLRTRYETKTIFPNLPKNAVGCALHRGAYSYTPLRKPKRAW
jgi:hypothetical protein